MNPNGGEVEYALGVYHTIFSELIVGALVDNATLAPISTNERTYCTEWATTKATLAVYQRRQTIQHDLSTNKSNIGPKKEGAMQIIFQPRLFCVHPPSQVKKHGLAGNPNSFPC